MPINSEPTLPAFFATRNDKKFTILSGANNTGKSWLLKNLVLQDAQNPLRLDVQRIHNFHSLETGGTEPRPVGLGRDHTRDLLNNDQINQEGNLFNLQEVCKLLNDENREKLFSLCGDLLGTTFALRSKDPANRLSPYYIDMGGQNLSLSSTGTRLLMSLIGSSLLPDYTSLYIDEPEFGLSPKLQSIVASYFFNEGLAREYFPHLQKIVFVTHSHLFLDRADITNNFIVDKFRDDVIIRPIETMADFHRLQFNMLGNTFESLFFPSAIVVVEGESDFQFLERVVALRFPEKRISVISAGGDDRTLGVVDGLGKAFGELQSSPYVERVFVVVDLTHGRTLRDRLIQKGIREDNLIVWSQNGIEFLYPKNIIREIFRCSETEAGNLRVDGDRITINGITKTKVELAKEVSRSLAANTPLPEELEEKLIAKIRTAID